MTNIEKSRFHRGQYVGYADGVWIITRTNSSYGNWIARKQDNPTISPIYAFRLSEMSQKLTDFENTSTVSMKRNPVSRALATLKRAEARGLRKNPRKRVRRAPIQRMSGATSDLTQKRKYACQVKKPVGWYTFAVSHTKNAAIEVCKAMFKAYPKAAYRVFSE